MRDIVKFAPEYSYIVIILRDFTVHCVMVYFIVRVNKRESNIKSELAKQDSPHDLQELKTVLNSCRPLMCFSNYLEEEKPEHMVLLEYVKVYETIQDRERDLDYLTIQKAESMAKIESYQSDDSSNKNEIEYWNNTIAEFEKRED